MLSTTKYGARMMIDKVRYMAVFGQEVQEWTTENKRILRTASP